MPQYWLQHPWYWETDCNPELLKFLPFLIWTSKLTLKSSSNVDFSSISHRYKAKLLCCLWSVCEIAIFLWKNGPKSSLPHYRSPSILSFRSNLAWDLCKRRCIWLFSGGLCWSLPKISGGLTRPMAKRSLREDCRPASWGEHWRQRAPMSWDKQSPLFFLLKDCFWWSKHVH